ncbi:unnamed protein product [Soboliphyme baturini]|uniref:Phosphatidylinositol-3-phosphatase n=1 Tax=Soboliphyme baturini TaxID=241478 RepID=A0A183J1B4_9BILA|nr:unnamed protein product [Soboliphyme baturini]
MKSCSLSPLFRMSSDSAPLWYILHTHISSVERGQITVSGSILVIRGKTFFTFKFIIPRDKTCQDVYDTLVTLSQCIEELPAFCYKESHEDDWSIISMYDDYARLGVPNDKWILSNFNEGYAVNITSYPEKLCVPRTAALSVLIGSSKFRSRGRLPVLSYLHRENGASICRCSQPLTGFNSRCGADEDLMHHVLKTNPRSGQLFIVDTRPKINAMANKAVGKGFEDENNYSDVRYHFLPVENIHAMRSSLNKMLESKYHGLENSGWMKHIRSLLETALFIAESVKSGVTVVVHCSDGWDRTPQTISLASIMLDPYYRTLHGFQTLIEKEWLKFGHKFSDRCGHIFQPDSNSKEIAPIFTQFLDCVWQLMVQFPQAFGFNEHYLLTVHDHVYSCQFGNFLCNCDKERAEMQLTERTYSFWGYVSRATHEFLNPVYDATSSSFLKPDLRPSNIRWVIN